MKGLCNGHFRMLPMIAYVISSQAPLAGFLNVDFAYLES